MWTQAEAIQLCRILEDVVPHYGAHVALTGGCLYKEGPRKDVDVLLYRIRQWPQIRMDAMWTELAMRGFVKKSGFGWCYKAEFNGKNVDCFFPEVERDENGNEIQYGAQQASPDEFAALKVEESHFVWAV
jgi:hypothetical protein